MFQLNFSNPGHPNKTHTVSVVSFTQFPLLDVVILTPAMASAKEDLLPQEGSLSSLLPKDTVIFASTRPLGKVFVGCLAFTLLLTATLLGLGFVEAQHNDFYIAAAVVALAGLLVCYILNVRSKITFQRQLDMGDWQEGVICFPSGDLVLRFSKFFNSVEKTIGCVSSMGCQQ